MENQNRPALSQAEINLIEKLRKHPQMMERVQSIMAIANDSDGPLKTADQVEELLIEELRNLGNTTINNWAHQAHERVAQELKAKDPTIRSRKKKR